MPPLPGLPPRSPDFSLLVLGHRGLIQHKGAVYQNSLKAFQEAIDISDGFETDACVSKDGKVFLIHEAKYVDPKQGVEYCAAEHLDAAGQTLMGSRRIDQMTLTDLKKIRLKDGSPLPTLTEALRLFQRKAEKVFNIELKAFEVVEPVLKEVNEALRKGLIVPQSLLISSFNHPSLLRVREKAPSLRVGAIFMESDQPTTPLFPWQPGSEGSYTPLTAESLRTPILEKLRPEYIIIPEDILSDATLKLVASALPAAQVIAWVFTEKGQISIADLVKKLLKLKSLGNFKGIMVDHPREFIAAVQKAGLRIIPNTTA